MTNDLRILKKELKSFAKRVKDFKYTDSALITFLLTGLIMLSGISLNLYSDEIKTQQEAINTSIFQLQKDFKRARQENNKLLRNTNLELIQLMEQGDHVVKSPWGSFQFGSNYVYNDWKGTYKGRGDKKDGMKYKRDETLGRYKYSSNSESYGRTNLALNSDNKEETVDIEVDASLRTKNVNKKAPSFTLTPPSGGLPPFEPHIIPAPERPAEPNVPNIVVFTPPALNYSGSGFGQTSNTEFNYNGGGAGVVNAFSLYDTGSGTLDINVVNGVPSWTGTLNATENGVTQILSTGQNNPGARINAFFNEAQSNGRNVVHKGNYKMKIDDGGGATTNGMIIFASINPYTGGPSGTYDFQGVLSLNGHNNPLSNHVLIGIEQQLLNKSTKMKNSGTINIDSGNNVIGIQIDTEGSHPSGNEMDNSAGKININAQNSIGIDFGYYSPTPLHTDLKLGTINVNGTNNYGFRMRDYTSTVTFGGWSAPPTPTYYDDVTVSGTGGKITVKGTENVGISIAQGISSGDPLSKITDLNVLVGGSKNIGFLRNKNIGATNNSNVMVLNGTTTGADFNFLSDATQGALVRSDKNEIKYDKDITVGATGVQNTLFQAGEQGTVRLGSGKTATSTSSNEFYGMTAGNFAANPADRTSGAKIINDGTLTISGDKSIAMAIDTGNNGENNGTVTFNGDNTSGIYSLGDYKQIATASLTINGKNNTSIYNKGNMILDGTTKIIGTDGSTGIFSRGGTITRANTSPVTITLTNTGTNKGIGIFADTKANLNLDDAQVSVVDGSSAVVSYDTRTNVSLKNSTVKYTGEGYALYAKDGTIDLTNSKITLGGKATGYEMDASGTLPITLTGATITVMSNDVTVMSLRNVPNLKLSTLAADLGTVSGGATIIDGTDPAGVAYDKYNLASVDGVAAYDIDTNLDKKIGADSTKATTNDYKFVRRVAAQRSIFNVLSGVTVNSVLSTAEETTIGAKSVVGLDISSSSYASSNADTGINLQAGSTINADRTDAGNGAVGLYTNYGKINTNASSTINVETGSNVVNDSGVGIYAVNGSEVNSAGTININGNKSIGILGAAYREDVTSGAAIVNEFVNSYGVVAPGQGTSRVVNTGTINLSGNNATGIYVKNNNSSAANTGTTATNSGAGKINLSGNNAIGILGDKARIANDATINLNGQEEFGMYANNGSIILNDTNGVINLANSAAGKNPNIGIFTDDVNTSIENKGKIIGGENTYGIYSQGAPITARSGSEIEIGDAGAGIYSTGSNINLDSGSKIKVGKNEAVGVFVTGDSVITGDANMVIGNDSFGYVIKPTSSVSGTTLTTNGTPITLGNNGSVYIYSSDKLGQITNNKVINSTGNNNYGIYSAGNIQNNADINFGTGTGSVGIYTMDGGTATNSAGTTITVSGTNSLATPAEYGMGMATSNGTIINNGTIKVGLDGGIGMFASGSGSKAINNGVIELSGIGTKGMYVDNGAVGENWGIIKTVPNPTNSGILGVVATSGGVIKNYGRIIIDGPTNKAGYLGAIGNFSNETSGGSTGTIIKTNGADGVVRKQSNPTSKTVGVIEIDAPAAAKVATIKVNGIVITPTVVNTNAKTPTPSLVTVKSPTGNTTIVDLKTSGLGSIASNEQAGTLGMYIDTSGVNYTHPIEGLNKLIGLDKVNLLFGNETARYTSSKVIEVGDNIVAPYNDMILAIASAGSGTKFSLGAASYTWIATATQDMTTGALGKVYLVKLPYQVFAKEGDEQTYTFLKGLEERYGVETSGREKDIFNKLNNLGKGEGHILAQAFDEMKGHQYSNIQQRTKETGDILNNEFSYLQNEWENPTKDSSKIKAFGQRGEYKTDTAGVVDYASNAYGVAYVHEKEGVTLGNKTGWYAGAVTNHFKFKDLGRSREDQTMMKAGIFKTVSPAKDHNGSLQWTISGEAFAGANHMKRRYWVVDDTFEAKSDYATYGVALRNELGKDIRTSERTSIRPYGALNLEYGRYTGIKEDGPMALEVRGNDYISVQPEVGVSFNYRQPVGLKSSLKASLAAAYTNELGEVNDVKNKAKLRGADAPHYELRGDKENRKGSGKFDLNLGFENTRFGVTVNAGYDTKGENVRGGIGFRAIY